MQTLEYQMNLKMNIPYADEFCLKLLNKVKDMNSYRLSYILHFYTHMHTQPHRSSEKSVIPNFLKSAFNWPIYLYLDENFDLVVVYNTAGKNSLKIRMKVNIWGLWKWNDSNLIMIKVFGTTLIGIWKQWMWKTISIFHQPLTL